MPGIKLQKREHDFFVSYGHRDAARVTETVRWLRDCCRISLWFDADHGNAATRSSELLSAAIGNARGALFFVSSGWTESTWCKNEFEVALTEQRSNDGFEIIAIRLDEAELPTWLRVAAEIDLQKPDLEAYARLLRSLSSKVPNRFGNENDVYLAAPWSRQSALVHRVLQKIGSGSFGWRLVGDSPNLKHLGEDRVAAIVRTTRGVVAVLPYDPNYPGHTTSPFILQEAEIAVRCGKPLLLMAEKGANLPPSLVAGAFRQEPVMLTADDREMAGPIEALEAFDYDVSARPHDDMRAFVFLATSLLTDAGEAEAISSVIEHASNLRCVRGERLSGENVQQAIIERIRSAAVVIADVTDDHRNTLIEAGVAMGAGTQLKLLAYQATEQPPKKRFMFEGQEIHLYRSPLDRLGLLYWIASRFRRNVYAIR